MSAESPPPPPSTYRLQLHAGFTLDEAAALVPYLRDLGIAALYLSPLFAARSGSTHGYDVVDPTRVDPELGGEQALERLAEAASAHDLGLVLDIVPNHMAADPESAWWRDVLRHGPASERAAVFDIDWHGLAALGDDGKVLLPLLGRRLGEALAAGELEAAESDEGPAVRYYEHELPLDPATWQGPPASTEELAEVLERQHYRLAHWPLASELVNYRRFFDISDLVGVRVEDPAVFAATQALVLRLARDGTACGLRVDHVDGLRDPLGYLERLAGELAGERPFPIWVEKILTGEEALPADWPVLGTTGYELIGDADRLLVDPPGLDAIAADYRATEGVEPGGFAELALEQKRRLLHLLFAGELRGLAERLVRVAQRDRSARDLSPRLLADCLAELSAAFPVYRSYARDGEPDATAAPLLEEAARLAARRLPAEAADALDFTRRALALEWRGGGAGQEELVARWQQLTGPLAAKGVEDTALYRWHALPALNEVGGEPEPAPATLGVEAFHARMAERRRAWPAALSPGTTHDTKRSEDVRARLLVLSELPGEWARAVAGWRRDNAGRRRFAGGRVAPDPGEELLVYHTLLGAWPYDDSELDELRERVAGYLTKALREAKQHSSWLDPDEDYEMAVAGFATGLVDEPADGPFQAGFRELLARVAPAGAVNSLTQALVRLTAPGLPDTYQGGELWNLSLTDPDNRRPVDFALRARFLAGLDAAGGSDRGALAGELAASWRDGRVKLHVTATALRLRRAAPELFLDGDYLPLPAEGERSRHVVAWARRLDGRWLVCAGARLVAGMVEGGRLPQADAWGEGALELPAGAPERWRGLLDGAVVEASGGRLPLRSLLAPLPVALLEASG